MVGLVEPINNRITDPRYYLNTPHQGKADISPQTLLQGRRFPHLQRDAEGPRLMKGWGGAQGFNMKLPA